MNDHIIQALLVFFLLVLNTILLFSYMSWFIILSVLLLKVYQIIGGGGIHLWACHNLYSNVIGKKLKASIGIFWVLCGIARASQFCKYHILHHAYCDKEGDPHSPNNHSILNLTLGLWSLSAPEKDKYITESIQNKIDKSNERIDSNSISKFCNKYHYAIIVLIIGLSLIVSPFFCLYFITLPMLLNIIDGNFFFVYYFHTKGKVKNIPWVNYWILNSGNHKNHHKWLK